MRFFWMLSLLLTVSLPAAEPLTAPGSEIVSGKNDAEWQPLFTALAGKGAIFADITEYRWFKVRKQPVVVKGEMRLSPEHGLSLNYQDRTVIMDARGVLLRDSQGRSREVKPDPHTPAVNTWLLPVLRFDLPALRTAFRLQGARADNAWRLDLVPLESAGGEVTGTITVFGVDDAITRLELRPKADLRIEIAIGATRTGVTFGADELQRYFR